MQQSINAIREVARAIPQGVDVVKQHSPEWRFLLQQIRNYFTPHRLKYIGDMELARIYQASLPIFAVEGNELAAVAKNALLDTIGAMAKRHDFYPMVGDTVPYKDGEFFIGDLAPSEIPANGEMIRVTMPTIYDAKGVICLGEFERI
jgi:hypothetical protein